MVFTACLLLGFSVVFVGLRLFWRAPLSPRLDSLRQSRAHHLLAGVIMGMVLPEIDPLFRQFNHLRHGLLAIGLVWIGFQIGLGMDLQRFRRLKASALAAHLTSSMLAALFAALVVLASGAILNTRLGLRADRPMAVVLLTCFIITVRYPEPTFRWRNRARPPIPDIVPDLPLANITALLLFSIGVPFFSQFFSRTTDPLALLGLARTAALLLAAGLTGGMALDFVLRAHRRIARGVAMAFGIVVVIAGLCKTLALPTLPVGFIAGVWLVNTTVAKRDILQFSSRATGVIEPLFFLMLGTLIGGYGGGPFFEFWPLIPFALLLLIVRAVGRTLGLAVSQYFWSAPQTWREVLDLCWRPLDSLSVALAVQGLDLLQLNHNTLIASMIMTVLFTQAAVMSPRGQTGRTALTALQAGN